MARAPLRACHLPRQQPRAPHPPTTNTHSTQACPRPQPRSPRQRPWWTPRSPSRRRVRRARRRRARAREKRVRGMGRRVGRSARRPAEQPAGHECEGGRPGRSVGTPLRTPGNSHVGRTDTVKRRPRGSWTIPWVNLSMISFHRAGHRRGGAPPPRARVVPPLETRRARARAQRHY